MQLFTVGKPISNFQESLLAGPIQRRFTKTELLNESLKGDTEIRLFLNYEDAIAYALSLNKAGSGHTMPQYIRNRLTAPIFKIEYNQNLSPHDKMIVENINYTMGPYKKVVNAEIVYFLGELTNFKEHIVGVQLLPGEKFTEFDSEKSRRLSCYLM